MANIFQNLFCIFLSDKCSLGEQKSLLFQKPYCLSQNESSNGTMTDFM